MVIDLNAVYCIIFLIFRNATTKQKKDKVDLQDVTFCLTCQ